MSWEAYEWKFKLKSPLHIGYHKVMHFFRTRPYVPGRPIWGAMTARLTRMLGLSNYRKVGNFLSKACQLGYLYICTDEQIFLPRYTEAGLTFGSLPQIEFEKKFISSMASTAIESESLTAEEGMLHEVEFISPYVIDDEPKFDPVFLRGLVWIKEFAEDEFEMVKRDDTFFVKYEDREIELKDLAGQLQIGGERKYGFGLVKLVDFREIRGKGLGCFPGEWEVCNGNVCVTLEKDSAIWSHLKYSESIEIKGNIEALVGRDWGRKGAGQKLTSFGGSVNLFWSPGSVINNERTFKIREFGIWDANM